MPEKFCQKVIQLLIRLTLCIFLIPLLFLFIVLKTIRSLPDRLITRPKRHPSATFQRRS